VALLEEIADLIHKYSHEETKVDFLQLYIVEAHAYDEWPAGDTLRIPQPKTLPQRCHLARLLLEKEAGMRKQKTQTVVDGMGNAFHEAYAAWPVRFYVVDPLRLLSYVAQPSSTYSYSVPHLDRFLAQLV